MDANYAHLLKTSLSATNTNGFFCTLGLKKVIQIVYFQMPNQLCNAIRLRKHLHNSIGSALQVAHVFETWEPALTWFVC